MIDPNKSIIERVARAWASMDGKNFDDPDAGHDDGYMSDAEELLIRSGLSELVAETHERAYRDGWRAKFAYLMQGGSETVCDFYDVTGECIGLYHGFFPKGTTSESRIAHYEAMLAFERAAEHAAPAYLDGAKDDT